MFDVVKQAGISVSDFARIAGVSRVSASQWMNGRVSPHRLHKRKIEQLLTAIKAGVDNEDLPVPGGLTDAQRLKRVKQVILQNMAQAKKSQSQEY
jgi:transcriptional regulator with XRE-family HTH domain